MHLLFSSASDLDWTWNYDALGGPGPGVSVLPLLTGPIQHFRDAIYQLWISRAAADLCTRTGLRGCPLLAVDGMLKLLTSPTCGESDRTLLQGA